MENTFSARRLPNYYYVLASILSLLVTACQGTSPKADPAAGPTAGPTVGPTAGPADASTALQPKRVEFTSPTSYRIAEEITAIDFKEVFLGAKVISVPVTWEIANKSDTIKAIKFTGERAQTFAAQLIGSSNKKKAYSHVFFVFSPSKVGGFETLATPSLVDDVRVEGIKLRGIGVAVLNQGKLMSYDISDSLKKGLDFGRMPAGTLGQRKFQVKNLDTLHAVEVSDVIVSSDFEVKTVKLSASLIYQGPVRSFKIPKGHTAEVTIEFKPPAGFKDHEKLFTGSVEFRNSTGTSRTGITLCGIAFHPPHMESLTGCYE
jgi:hypothetical protein